MTEIDAMSCARVCGQLGGSRYKASDVIDPTVGIVIKRHVGCHVNEGKQSLNPNCAILNSQVLKLRL